MEAANDDSLTAPSQSEGRVEQRVPAVRIDLEAHPAQACVDLPRAHEQLGEPACLGGVFGGTGRRLTP